jgi:hypothetical protein
MRSVAIKCHRMTSEIRGQETRWQAEHADRMDIALTEHEVIILQAARHFLLFSRWHDRFRSEKSILAQIPIRIRPKAPGQRFQRPHFGTGPHYDLLYTWSNPGLPYIITIEQPCIVFNSSKIIQIGSIRMKCNLLLPRDGTWSLGICRGRINKLAVIRGHKRSGGRELNHHVHVSRAGL